VLYFTPIFFSTALQRLSSSCAAAEVYGTTCRTLLPILAVTFLCACPPFFIALTFESQFPSTRYFAEVSFCPFPVSRPSRQSVFILVSPLDKSVFSPCPLKKQNGLSDLANASRPPDARFNWWTQKGRPSHFCLRNACPRSDRAFHPPSRALLQMRFFIPVWTLLKRSCEPRYPSPQPRVPMRSAGGSASF